MKIDLLLGQQKWIIKASIKLHKVCPRIEITKELSLIQHKSNLLT